jgi:predicted CopG family antitoxin
MAKTIAVSDEVYELLRRSKLPGESFSAVIKRNLKRGRISDIAGSMTLTRSDWEVARKRISESEAATIEKLERNS